MTTNFYLNHSSLVKQSSQQSQESFPNQLISKVAEARKISDTPSYSSSILKNRSTSSSPNKVSLHEVQLATASAKNVSSGKLVDFKEVKKTEKRTSIFKSSKDKVDSKSDGRPSISSLKKSEAKARKSLFKKADPKLRIRPFKSKVTFSDEPQKIAKDNESPNSDAQSVFSGANYTIPDDKSTLTIHLDKYDLSASSPELNLKNKASTSGKFPYSRHKLSIDKAESEDRLMNIRMKTGSTSSVFTTAELFNKLPIETLLQLGLPSNQSSQSSEQKLGADSDQRERASSLSTQALEAIRKAQINKEKKFKNEIPGTYLHKPSQSEANRRKSFQLPSSQQAPIEMHSEYDINFQDNYKTDSNDYWLRHRSLPNIQEMVEDSGSENPSSPTSKEAKDGSSKFTDQRPIVTTKKLPKDSVERLQEKRVKKDDYSEASLMRSSSEILKQNAQERRTLYSKASKSSSSSNQSSSSLQRKCRKKIPIHLTSGKAGNFKQSSTDSDSSYYTAHSVHITIPEEMPEPLSSIFQTSNESISSAQQQPPASTAITMPPIPEPQEILKKDFFYVSNESTNSNSYHSASELFKRLSQDTLNESTHSLSTEAGTIPTIVVMPTSPVTSEQNVFFGQTDQELQEERRRRLMEHFHMSKQNESGNRLDTEASSQPKDDSS